MKKLLNLLVFAAVFAGSSIAQADESDAVAPVSEIHSEIEAASFYLPGDIIDQTIEETDDEVDIVFNFLYNEKEIRVGLSYVKNNEALAHLNLSLEDPTVDLEDLGMHVTKEVSLKEAYPYLKVLEGADKPSSLEAAVIMLNNMVKYSEKDPRDFVNALRQTKAGWAVEHHTGSSVEDIAFARSYIFTAENMYYITTCFSKYGEESDAVDLLQLHRAIVDLVEISK